MAERTFRVLFLRGLLARFSKSGFLAGNPGVFTTQPPFWQITAVKVNQKFVIEISVSQGLALLMVLPFAH